MFNKQYFFIILFKEWFWMKYNSNRYFENMLGYYKYIVCDGNLSNYKIDKFKKFLNGFDLKFGSIKYNEEKDRIDMKLELENSNINYYYNDTFILWFRTK